MPFVRLALQRGLFPLHITSILSWKVPLQVIFPPTWQGIQNSGGVPESSSQLHWAKKMYVRWAQLLPVQRGSVEGTGAASAGSVLLGEACEPLGLRLGPASLLWMRAVSSCLEPFSFFRCIRDLHTHMYRCDFLCSSWKSELRSKRGNYFTL